MLFGDITHVKSTVKNVYVATSELVLWKGQDSSTASETRGQNSVYGINKVVRSILFSKNSSEKPYH